MEEDEFPIGLKILVVDDDETCLFILERMLQSLKYQGTSISFFDMSNQTWHFYDTTYKLYAFANLQHVVRFSFFLIVCFLGSGESMGYTYTRVFPSSSRKENRWYIYICCDYTTRVKEEGSKCRRPNSLPC